MAIAAVAPTPLSRPMGDLTDHELVAAVRAGDDRAFEVLYARYHRRIVSYVAGMVRDHARAEDVTQDVFLSALRRMRETQRPIIVKAWLYEIAKNACIDQFRRSRRAEEVSFDAGDALGLQDQGRLVAHGATPDVAVEHKQRLDDLCGAFGDLSESHHDVLVLRELEGLSYREIGDRLGMTRPAVESTLFRARRRLSEEYDDLATGRRCERTAALVTAAAAGSLAARDHGRLGRHLSRCPSCRRAAHRAGVDTRSLVARPVLGRLAALLPLPAFLRRGGSDEALGSSLAAQQPALASWSGVAVQAADSGAVAWVKAVAAAAAVALAGTGVNVAGHDGGLRLPAAPGATELVVRSPDHDGGATLARPAVPTAVRGTSGTSRGAAGRSTSAAAPAPVTGERGAAAPGAHESVPPQRVQEPRPAPGRPAARVPRQPTAGAPDGDTVGDVLRTAPSTAPAAEVPAVVPDDAKVPASDLGAATGELRLGASGDTSPAPRLAGTVTGAVAPAADTVAPAAATVVDEAVTAVETVAGSAETVTRALGDAITGG